MFKYLTYSYVGILLLRGHLSGMYLEYEKVQSNAAKLLRPSQMVESCIECDESINTSEPKHVRNGLTITV
jgi:hypothetical protein